MFPLARFDAIGERSSLGLTEINSRFLAMLGKRIKAIEDSKLSIEEQRAAVQKELDLFLRELKREGEKAAKKADEVYTEAAKQANAIPLEVVAKFGKQAMTTGALEQIVRTVSAITEGTFYNLGRTKAAGIRVARADGRVFYESLSQAYIRIVDDAITRVATGVTDYKSEVRRGLKEVADSGLRIIDYESGYSRRMDSALRQNITDGVRSIAEQISAENGRKFGADGVEIDAHNYCAPDHLPYQGRMFSNEEYAKIEESLDRKFMTWNCRHSVYPVILGVSTPSYTKEERQAMYENSTRKFVFEGKEYTGYEGTQLQRRLESEIRKSKDRAVLFTASGDDLARRVEQTRINALKHKYMDVSKTFGLPYAADRMGVPGFRAVKKTLISPEEIDFESVNKIQHVANFGDQRSLYPDTEPGKRFLTNLPVHYNEFAANHLLSDDTHASRLKWIKVNCNDFVRAIENPEIIEKALRPRNDGHFSATNIVKLRYSGEKEWEFMAVAISLSKDNSGYHQVTTIHPLKFRDIFNAKGELKKKYLRVE
ncbi:MAG: phage minor capsid protein [Anaerolineaceae bacterium]|nr:phage minor capsid protein [Anaerolineaceae bacterium]